MYPPSLWLRRVNVRIRDGAFVTLRLLEELGSFGYWLSFLPREICRTNLVTLRKRNSVRRSDTFLKSVTSAPKHCLSGKQAIKSFFTESPKPKLKREHIDLIDHIILIIFPHGL